MKEENNQISTKYKYADEFNQKTVYKKIININTIDRTLNHTIEEFIEEFIAVLKTIYTSEEKIMSALNKYTKDYYTRIKMEEVVE